MKKNETVFEQAEKINTVKAYDERNEIYKSMSFEEIINLINEVEEITRLIATNHHEFILDASEIGSIGTHLSSMNKVGECLNTISQIEYIYGRRSKSII